VPPPEQSKFVDANYHLQYHRSLENGIRKYSRINDPEFSRHSYLIRPENETGPSVKYRNYLQEASTIRK